MHNLHLGGSPGAVLFGTTTIGLAQGETLLTITPAFSNISNSLYPFSMFQRQSIRFLGDW